MSRLRSTLAIIWRLAHPYFFSEDRWAGRSLLAAVIAIELSIVGITVMINQWNNRFYNALQERNWDIFVSELLFFCALATAYIVLAVYQLYLNQWLQIRWRRWMTRQYLDKWLGGANHYRMQLLGDAADNPDQRITEDIHLFVDRTLAISVGLLSAIVTLASFVMILWALSATAPLKLFGTTVSIPGYLVWAALLYAVVGTALTHVIGWPLVALNFRQQRFEADFRFNLVRVRENSEQIALLAGETAERDRLLDRFGKVVANWMLIMQRTKRLTFLTASYAQISVVFPFVVVSPAYFAGAVQLGGLMQAASAFNSVQTALSFFVTAYRQLAEWRAVVARLDGFEIAAENARAAATAKPAIEVVPDGGRNAVEIDDLLVRLPQGAPLVAADDIVIAVGERVLVTGPSGAGKSTLLRAIAGVWPFGTGAIVVPKGAKLMALPQRPYFPVGTLAAAVTYPAEPGTFDAGDARRGGHRGRAGGPRRPPRRGGALEPNAVAGRAGAPRHCPRAPAGARLPAARRGHRLARRAGGGGFYQLLTERLPGATVVSIGHRSTLSAFHRRGLALVREGDSYRVRESALEQAAT